MQTTKGVQSELATAGTGFGVSAVLPSLSSSPSLLLILVKRLIHGETWLIPPETEAPCTLALVSARLELVGEPPGLVEGAVGGKPCPEVIAVIVISHGIIISIRINFLKCSGHFILIGLEVRIIECSSESADVCSPWRHLAASRRKTGTVATLAVPGLVLG